MLSTGLTSQEELRYERKYFITDYVHQEVEQFVKFHPAAFKEIFHERIVNNIYFDNLGFNNYYDNVEGERDRLKVRIRWYGDMTGQIEKPILEFKIKKGLLGKKNSYSLAPFQVYSDFSSSEIIQAIQHLPEKIQNHVLALKPVLLNSYTRKYFLSADQKFRITIDHHLTYTRINYAGKLHFNKHIDYQSTILELKYDEKYEPEAKSIGANLPFPLTKNSKYLQGLERILF